MLGGGGGEREAEVFPFNSLFEMRDTVQETQADSLDFQFSI